MKWNDALYYGKMILFLSVILVAVFLLSGCKTSCVPMEKVVYRDVVKHRTDTVFNTDSVWLKDSVIVRQRGDTVYLDRWHTKWKSQYIYKVKTDTLIVRDTVNVSASATKNKDAVMTISIDKYGFITLVFALVLVLVWLIKRFRLWLQR